MAFGEKCTDNEVFCSQAIVIHTFRGDRRWEQSVADYAWEEMTG